MNGYEQVLFDAKTHLVDSLCEALENGVPFSRCLELLGVEGKAMVMARAFTSRYTDAQLAEMLREATSSESPDQGIVEGLRAVD